MTTATQEFLSLDALGIDSSAEARAVMPAGGIAFGAGSMIGPWLAKHRYSFLSDTDIAGWNLENDDNLIPAPDMQVPRGDEWYQYYYTNYQKALEAMNVLKPETEFKPDAVWVFVMSTDDVLNRDPEQLKPGFGEQVIFDTGKIVSITSVGSPQYPAKKRHMANFISIPAAVAAAARATGIATDAVYDLSELLEAGRDFTDEFFEEMCGDVRGSYGGCILAQRRETLWKLLGEEDVRKSTMTGSKTASGNPHPLATTSEKLSRCLALVEGEWKKPIWARLTLVPNPHPDAMSNNGNRLNIPTITQLFGSQAAAQEAADAEKADVGDDVESVAPKLPENWAGYRDTFITEVKKYDGPRAGAATTLDCTLEEYEAWVTYIQDKGL